MIEKKWNKEIVRDYFRFLREGDVDRLFLYFDPDAVFEVPGLAIGGRFVGRRAIRTYLLRIQSLFGAEPEIGLLVAEGNAVTADLTLHGRLPNGTTFDFHMLSIFEFRDWKITRLTLFFDTERLARRLAAVVEAFTAA